MLLAKEVNNLIILCLFKNCNTCTYVLRQFLPFASLMILMNAHSSLFLYPLSCIFSLALAVLAVWHLLQISEILNCTIKSSLMKNMINVREKHYMYIYTQTKKSISIVSVCITCGIYSHLIPVHYNKQLWTEQCNVNSVSRWTNSQISQIKEHNR